MGDHDSSTPGSPHHQEDGPSPAMGSPTPSSLPPNRSYRNSQYAENIANPLPELAVSGEEGTELEAFPRLSNGELDDSGCSTRAVVEPDDISDHRPAAVVYAGEEPTRWRKYRKAVIIALVFLILALAGTVAGILVANAKNNQSAGARPSTSPMPTSPSATMSTESSSVPSATTTGSSVPTPSQCTDSSGFVTSVSFMGVKGAAGNGGWETEYCGSASNAQDCCACCYKNKDGCNSWAYYASSGFAGTRCALIVGWDTDDGKDSTCPAGHDATMYFSEDSDDSGDVGATGPCGIMAD